MRLIAIAALMWLAAGAPLHAQQATVYLLTPPSDICQGVCPGQLSAIDVDAGESR
jgi:hypothetical protein